MVRSPHHHARILSVDTREAEKVPGVVRVLTHKDVPKNVYTILCLIQVEPDDEPCLAVDKVRYKGEQIVAVLAESEAAAREAVAKVKVEYEELPAVFDVEEALKPGAPLVNEYPRPELLQIRGPSLPARALRRRREGLRRRRSRPRGALPVLADRACADRDDRLHRRARRERPLHLPFQHAGAVLHARQHRADPRTRRSRSSGWSAARSAAASAARST